GQSANLSVESFPKEAFTGTVKGIAPVLDPRTRSIAVQIDVPDPQSKLKPGMFAQLAIQTGQRAAALLVPKEAVLRVGSVDPTAPVVATSTTRPTLDPCTPGEGVAAQRYASASRLSFPSDCRMTRASTRRMISVSATCPSGPPRSVYSTVTASSVPPGTGRSRS